MDLSTDDCVVCAGREGLRQERVGGVLALPVAIAIALAVPLALTAFVRALWGGRDLYDVMADGAPALTVAAAPLWAPCLLAACVPLLTRVAAPRLRLSVCAPCRTGTRRRAIAAWLAQLVVIAGSAALFAVALPRVTLFETLWGIFFLPWAFLAAWLFGRAHSSGVRARLVTRDAIGVTGAPHLAEVLGSSKPGALVDRTASRLAPPPAQLALWLLPLGVVVALARAPTVRQGDGACGYGSWPLGYRHGAARADACLAPDGERHGPFRGGPGSWNTSSNVAVEGAFWRGSPDGEFTFRDPCGTVRAIGRFDRGRPKGAWRFFDERGAPSSPLDADAARMALLQAGADCSLAAPATPASPSPAAP